MIFFYFEYKQKHINVQKKPYQHTKQDKLTIVYVDARFKKLGPIFLLF